MAATQEMMRRIVRTESPDLIVYGGDQVADDSTVSSETEGIKNELFANWKTCVETLANESIPWVSIIGNHDSIHRHMFTSFLAYDASFEGSLTQVENDGNFKLSVLAPASRSQLNREGKEPVMLEIFLFNSKKDGCIDIYEYGCIEPKIVRWFEATATPGIPSIAFIHIPPREMLDVYNSGEYFGTMEDYDGICCTSLNSGLISSFLHSKSVKAVVFGNDHGNDFFGNYKGLPLVYGLKSGRSGMQVTKSGSRILQVKFYLSGPTSYRSKGYESEDLESNLLIQSSTSSAVSQSHMIQYDIETWLRYDDGSKVVQKQAKADTSNPQVDCCVERTKLVTYIHAVVSCIGVGLLMFSYLPNSNFCRLLLLRSITSDKGSSPPLNSVTLTTLEALTRFLGIGCLIVATLTLGQSGKTYPPSYHRIIGKIALMLLFCHSFWACYWRQVSPFCKCMFTKKNAKHNSQLPMTLYSSSDHNINSHEDNGFSIHFKLIGWIAFTLAWLTAHYGFGLGSFVHQVLLSNLIGAFFGLSAVILCVEYCIAIPFSKRRNLE